MGSKSRRVAFDKLRCSMVKVVCLQQARNMNESIRSQYCVLTLRSKRLIISDILVTKTKLKCLILVKLKLKTTMI